MIRLINTDIEKFKKVIYPEYIDIFHKSERKSYEGLERVFRKGF